MVTDRYEPGLPTRLRCLRPSQRRSNAHEGYGLSAMPTTGCSDALSHREKNYEFNMSVVIHQKVCNMDA
jgi:hypothetical protein